MRISDWSSDVCSSDLGAGRALSGALASGEAAQERVDLVLDLVEVDGGHLNAVAPAPLGLVQGQVGVVQDVLDTVAGRGDGQTDGHADLQAQVPPREPEGLAEADPHPLGDGPGCGEVGARQPEHELVATDPRSAEHQYELQTLMHNSSA